MSSTQKDFRKFKDLINTAIVEGSSQEQLMQKKLLHDFINDQQKLISKKELDTIVNITKKQALLDIGTVRLLIKDKKLKRGQMKLKEIKDLIGGISTTFDQDL